MPPLIPLQKTSFSFDVSSLAGFLGAEAALSVMMLPHIHTRRKWWGWYNCPGSYHLSKRYGELARFEFWRPFWRPSSVPVNITLEPTTSQGPKYTSARSGVVLLHTGPLAPLLVEGCCAVEAVEMRGRESEAVDVVIANLRREPQPCERPRVPDTCSTWLAVFPILATLSAGIASVYFHDIYCAAMILLGPVCHGLACLVMGNAKFTYQHRIPQESPPLGDGWLECQRSFVVLFGTEAAVAPVTHGRFYLTLDQPQEYYRITLCSFLLAVQFLLQLLLVPQGSRFGQHILACAKDNVLRRILMSDILGEPALLKYRFGTRTAAVVFLVLALRPAIGPAVEARLRALLPSNTPVWQLWHEVVAHKIKSGEALRFEECSREWQESRGLQYQEGVLFRTLIEDAEHAYAAYLKHSPGID
ncbi:hypothetical protein C8Q78DRAFT_1070224 [Trametes maxima]|nr:hypothetical protein C8Q78DRAFT_1070224 [Trametes maxima]